MRDCTNRPSFTKKRKVIIEVEFEPGSSALDDAGMGLGTVGISARTRTKFLDRAGSVGYLGIKTKQVGNETSSLWSWRSSCHESPNAMHHSGCLDSFSSAT